MTKDERTAKGKKAHAAWMAKYTPEQRRAFAEKAWAGRTPKKRSEIGTKGKATRMAKYTPEELSAFGKRGTAKRTPEQRSANLRARWAKLTPEERSAINKNLAAKRTPEQRSASAKKGNPGRIAKFTPERRDAFGKRVRENYAALKAAAERLAAIESSAAAVSSTRSRQPSLQSPAPVHLKSRRGRQPGDVYTNIAALMMKLGYPKLLSYHQAKHCFPPDRVQAAKSDPAERRKMYKQANVVVTRLLKKRGL